jgi:AmmeMemoRadiSam system protein A
MCSTDPISRECYDGLPSVSGLHLSEDEKEVLRQVASDSIREGVSRGYPLTVEPGEYSPRLQAPGAVFVTLELGGELRGCIGSYLARRPLVEDVAQNAFAAAFRDPRFPPLTEGELADLDLHLSLLTPPERLDVGSRTELLGKLRPGLDGLLLEDPPHRSTFLPQVWEALPDPELFLEELFLKGGMARNHWSETLKVSRYRVLKF